MSETQTIEAVKAAALEDAKRAFKGNTGLARALSEEARPDRTLTPQAISQWKQVPAERVLEVERVSGVSRHRLRPDLYPEQETAA
ncbi:MAG: repressor [Bradyrhizobium sp.]|nr:repressor [Bradyrhizobium sp.]